MNTAVYADVKLEWISSLDKVDDIRNQIIAKYEKEISELQSQIRKPTQEEKDADKAEQYEDLKMCIRDRNTSQRALTWLPTYARKVKNIAEEGFFKNSIEYSDTCRKNGEYLQVVCRSVMNVFHFDSYKRGAKEVCDYLEDNGSMEEFNTIQKYFQRIENACGEECKTILVKKDIPVDVYKRQI